MATKTVRGALIDYDTAGRGPTLIWGHGLTSNRVSEDEAGYVDWAVAREEIEVVRYDARGHGLSEFTYGANDYKWDNLGLDQLALATSLGHSEYVSGGASMGAATALHAACVAPERLLGLVLMIPPTAWETREAQTEIYETMASTIETKGVEFLLAMGPPLPPPDPFAGGTEWADRRARAMRRADPKRLAGVLRGATRAQFPTREAVSQIQIPTLILAWTGDPGHPVSTAEELGSLMPTAEVHLASTAGELGTWTSMITSFVRSVWPRH